MAKSKQAQLIVVDSDGELLTCSDGYVSGSREDMREVKVAALLEKEVMLVQPFGEYVKAGIEVDEPIRIVAALFSVRPGRSKLMAAPDSVWEWFENQIEQYGENLDREGYVDVYFSEDDEEENI